MNVLAMFENDPRKILDANASEDGCEIVGVDALRMIINVQILKTRKILPRLW